MHVFPRADVGSRPPRLARDEPLAAIFAGTPLQVAGYVASRMAKQPDTLGPLTAELTHLAEAGGAGDSLCMVLDDRRKVTIRP
jgi:hypothetical protein